MVAKLVKLFFVLIESKTSSVTSPDVSFSRRKYALSFLTVFSPSFLFTIVDLSLCEMETSSSGSLEFFSAYLKLSEDFRRASAFTRS